MRRGLSVINTLLAIILSVAVPFAGSAPSAKALMQGGGAKTVVFVVSQNVPAYASMIPILLIEQGQYKPPVAGDSDAAEIARFAAEYYGKGKKYRVLFGGGDAGSLTVQGATDSECERTAAKVSLRTSAKLNKNVMALATNSDSLGRDAGSRRAPTPQERAAVLPLARNAFTQKGVPAALLSTLDVVNLTAMDLNGDGKAELVGSFVVKKTKGGQVRYVLFLIAEPDGNGFKTGLANYERHTEKDIMSGANIDAIGQGGIYTERLVDQLDLDGDGTAEVITITVGFEGDSYTIYQKKSGPWAKIYDFGNYRCAF
jgi:hypothetical protein